jgi:hypothetical protein
MKSREYGWVSFCQSIRRTRKVFLSTVVVSAWLGLSAGCSSGNKASAPSFDEYLQPLTNAVIGSPGGVTMIGAAADAGISGSSSGGGASDGGFGVGPDGGPTGDGGTAGGFGFWHFDDCSPTSNFLVDSSGSGDNAQHALGASCVPGISGLGVSFRSAKDVVQVPDQPQFTVSNRIGVAAWVHPNTVDGHHPIVIKRLGAETTFSLGIHNGNIEMAVVLDTGLTVISRAPIAPGVWSHVAGMFDGTFVFLFLDGQQFGQVYGAGTLHDVFAPIRIGATSQTQFFDGIIDEVFVSTQAIDKTTLTDLACISHPSTLAVNPATSGPVPFNTTVHYDVNVTDGDIGFCNPKSYDVFFQSSDSGITATLDSSSFISGIQPGQTATFGVDVIGSDIADPGVHDVPFTVIGFDSRNFFGFEQLQGQLVYELAVPPGCFVFASRELMIKNTSIVDDPTRTFGQGTVASGGGGDGGVISSDAGVVIVGGGGGGSGSSGGPVRGGGGPAPSDAALASDVAVDLNSPSLGVWTFGHLMREMAPTPAQAPAMTLQLFQHWLTTQTVNGFSVAPRTAMQQELLDIWPKMPNGDLDLDHTPLTLQAIVNRVDIRNLAQGSAGEGRFVFAPQGPTFGSFTVIVEFNLPAQTQQDVLDWANRWHALSSHPFPSEEYNMALEAITRRFADRGAAPGNVNGSALAELRTNEIALSSRWELRGFVLSPSTGFFDETTVKETPDLSFNGTKTLADFVNQNAAAIKAVVPGAMAGTVPLQFEGQNFLGGNNFNDLIRWNAPGITDPDARFSQSLNTCNGCHGPETNTTFLMITPRFSGSEAVLSPFITGTTVQDPFSGQTRTINDLSRRKADLNGLVCTDGGAPPPVDAAPPPVDAPPPPIDAGSRPPPDATLPPPPPPNGD